MFSRKPRPTERVKKYDVSFRLQSKDDIQKIPPSIGQIFARLSEDEFLSGLIACGELRGNILHLRSCDPNRKTNIQENMSRIGKLFGVILEPAQPMYLFMVVGAQAVSSFRMKPETFSKLHCVGYVELYRKCSNWYLRTKSLDDALSIALRETVVLDRDHCPFAVRPITRHFYQCFKCSTAGHYQDQCKSEVQICGRCKGQHETRHCTVMERKNFQCPNCSPEDGKGHASYFIQCKNPNTRAVWADAMAEPEWHKNAGHDTQASRQPQSLSEPTPNSVADKPRKRGRPSKAAACQPQSCEEPTPSSVADQPRKRGRPTKADVERRKASGTVEPDGGPATKSGKRRPTEEPDGESAPQLGKKRRIGDPGEPGRVDKRNTMENYLASGNTGSEMDENEASEQE